METSSVGERPPRQIVLLCDGTNNNLTGGYADTNVVKLVELLAAHPDANRLVFYDPGVGNAQTLPGATSWDRLLRWGDRVRGLALGRGLFENIVESYLFLMRHYRKGDQLYVVGFSRGAFTARSVAGLVNQFGLLAPHMEGMLPTLLNVYFSDRVGDESKARVDAVADQIRRQCVHLPAVDIHFTGVWDTVASVGFGPLALKITALPTLEGKRFIHVRQALALDEHRAQFKPRLYAQPDGRFQTKSGAQGTVKQVWFPGSHCDVGGGYEGELCHQSDLAFYWLVSEAVGCGLRLTDSSGQPLDTPQLLEKSWPQVHAPTSCRLPACAHSELCSNPAWAIGGMAVRDTTQVVMDNGDSKQLASPVAHPSVPILAATKPSSVWVTGRAGKSFWIALALLPVFWLLQANMLLRDGLNWSSLTEAVDVMNAFQRWQIAGAVEWLAAPNAWSDAPHSLNTALVAHWTQFGESFDAPRWSVTWDFAFLACYALVLSWLAAGAFARCAGLRKPGDGARPWLDRLGHTLQWAVVADICENVAMWAAIAFAANGVPWAAAPLHCVAALSAILKFASLAGVAALIACSFTHKW